ncbi:MAG: DNA polymerase I, partial [Deltaproteobacteria bacterium]|nr:DNA polymerase I [Deltaproteobacteria bacterium]
MGTMPKLYLIDASAYFYRAFFALPPLTTSGGLPINAIYGFTTMLQKLMADHQPKYLAAVLDRPEPTFRHAVYQDYKANRDEMPDNLSVQIPYIKDVIRGFNIVALEKPGYEADDIIGTVALRAAADGAEVVIVSGDKDLFQLVRPGITVLDTMKDRVFDSQGVLDKYGLGPDQIIDMLGLMGDTSDNVPGVPGIGPKTAVSLLAQFGSMDGIYEHIESITKKKVKQNLLEFRDQAYLSRRLVTLDTAVSLERSWKDCRVISPDTEALRELFKQFEFTRLLKGLTPQKKTKKDYRLVGDKAGIEALIGKLRDLPRFTLDLETTSADPMRAEIVGISFAWEDDRAWYVPVAHQ